MDKNEDKSCIELLADLYREAKSSGCVDYEVLNGLYISHIAYCVSIIADRLSENKDEQYE